VTIRFQNQLSTASRSAWWTVGYY